MSTIILSTKIKAPIGICFDLSRSAELHMLSTAQTNETAIAGRTSGLFDKGDVVTWRARHFGIYQKMTVQITNCMFPSFFEDKMVTGAFKSFTHKHFFEDINGATIMKDHFEYNVPYGLLGKVFDKIILYNYMRRLLLTRNRVILQVAESKDWQIIVPKSNY